MLVFTNKTDLVEATWWFVINQVDMIIREASTSPPIYVEDSRKEILVAWTSPSIHSYKVNVDGLGRRGEGSSACRALVRDSLGTFFRGFHCNVGVCNAVWAELWALFLGLKLARSL